MPDWAGPNQGSSLKLDLWLSHTCVLLRKTFKISGGMDQQSHGILGPSPNHSDWVALENLILTVTDPGTNLPGVVAISHGCYLD